MATNGSTTVTTLKPEVGNLGPLNYLEFETMVANATRNVELQNVIVFKEATNLGTVWNASGTSAGLHQLYATGEDLTGSFKVTATLVITGSPRPGGDSNYVQMKVGYVTPPDNQAPIVSNVQIEPNPPLLNGCADVEANVDDSTTGGNKIVEANYCLNMNPWVLMAALDEAFDEVSEDVIGTIDPLTEIGVNTICVSGKDSAGNVSGTTDSSSHHPCMDFVVAYAFDGFYSPVDNNILNNVKAGQAIPFKWRLTDAKGDPIRDPASFVKFMSYPISCDNLTGIIDDSVEEYAAGGSSLQYIGDGYWQFNWKTPKNYASTCRAAYVQFNSTQLSPIIAFRLKK